MSGLLRHATLALIALLATTTTRASDIVADDAALGKQVAALEQRAMHVQDTLAIKRLQRAYGYYFDEGLWDEVANLFAADGSIELALDGVYRGRERVRAYLYAYGQGRKGLQAGQLHEHLQLMPVVTVNTDGRTALGTWRAVILAGHKGGEAIWGEGPYENTYVKENGVWKIQSLHWFQTVYVPYDGGWTKHADVNGGRFVTTLKPDSPPSVQYGTWPKAFTPPFHFRPQFIAARQAAAVRTAAAPPAGPLGGREAQRRVAQLAANVQQVNDQLDVENLQRIYGFYIDKSQWSQAADLFTDDAEMEIAGVGLWRGRASILRALQSIGPEAVLQDLLHDNMQLQGIVHVAPDGRSAQGRWHWFAQLARAGQFHEWGVGIYENRYRKDGGSWRIQKLRLQPTMITPYEAGWHRQSLAVSRLAPTAKPDRASRLPSVSYERAAVVPFHYAHPVTGTPVAPAKPLPMQVSTGALNLQLARLEAQLGRAEDMTAIENLQMTYGYYLATLLWDELTELFHDNGTIEIAMRGIYVGKSAVRRNLNLYGQAGLDDGVLHNHMQYQPVVSVSADGRSAKLRSRALSMMGNWQRSGMWMGGTYENELAKVDGQWKFIKDQQMNTYFAPYDVGWKDLKLRPPPGITESNPPDRAPSFVFEMYPKGFLPPYHYANPVTGR